MGINKLLFPVSVGLSLLTIAWAISNDPLASYHVVYGWKILDFKFPSDQARNRALSNGDFIPENNVITGIKVRGNTIYLTVPRWRKGVPATLVSVDFDPQDTVGVIGEPKGPPLNPYPSWEMNQIGNCDAFQYTQSMEIDQYGRMWVIDVGRINIFANTSDQNQKTKCPPKLVILDTNTGDIIHKYEFPKDVVSPSNFLNDVAVACESEKNCYAYISDALDARIVVYNYGENRSWFVHHSSMIANPQATNITILGYSYNLKVNVDGITVSPKDRGFNRVYYSPLSSLDLFSVPTSVLKSAVNGDMLQDSEVRNEGTMSSQPDGLGMDAYGLLFYGLLSKNGVAYFNTSGIGQITGKEVLLLQNDFDLQWPDTFSFDNSGHLYTVTNRLQLFKGNSYDFADINLRIIRTYTGSPNYMYSASAIRKEAESQTIPPYLLHATPTINLDIGNNGSPMTNSSAILDPYKTGVLLFILVTFTLHPILV